MGLPPTVDPAAPDAGTTGRVVRILDETWLLANVGLEHGVATGDVFAVFAPGEEVTDPETGESLGRLELVKARVQAVHVQAKLVQLAPLPSTNGAGRDRTVLSAVLASPHMGGGGGGHALAVRRDQLAGRPGISPIQVGDHVRRIGAGGSIPQPS